METNVNIRMLAMQILLDVEQNHKFLKEALHTTLRRYQYMAKQERGFLTRLCEGTVENQIYLDYVIDTVSNTPVSKCKPVIRVILRMGVYQICFMDRVPDMAAVNESVKLVRKKGFHQLTGFVNGVLRNVIRKQDAIVLPDETKQPNAYLSVRYSIPEWLVAYLHVYYPYPVLKGMFEAFLTQKGTCIRVNDARSDRETVKEMLKQQEIRVEPLAYTDRGFRIADYNYMLRVPGFMEGAFCVQDQSSMLVGQVLSVKPDSFVLDLCAAPGGKSLDICDRLLCMAKGQKCGKVLARDISQEKIEKIAENQERLQFPNLSLEVWDATKLDTSMLGKADYVICDVPCSGIGVIGRKQEIKYRLSPGQIEELIDIQRKILNNAWQYLKPGGVMVFSTCTINPKENEENLQWLLAQAPVKTESLDAYLPASLHNEQTAQGYLTLVPGIHESDGFFIARVRRVES